ncbi:MAG: dockerin type I domain-containing protein [Defluviitaleaceae bacterium]|nr:dockerin type I domain-containing protein [Defluviitaleaceae bacterium]
MKKSKIVHLLVFVAILMLGMVMSVNASTYNYDSLNRITKIIHENGDSISYAYDGLGNITRITTIQGGYVTVTFILSDNVLVISGELVQILPQGSEAVAPIVSRKGWIFDEWDTDVIGITTDTTVAPIWLRLGNVSLNGRGNVTSADVVWLARHIAGHAGFDSPDERIADINGDGIVDASDITALLRWLTGYDLDDLKVQTEAE